jgi:hypothetical protein
LADETAEMACMLPVRHANQSKETHMLRQTLSTLSASAVISAVLAATNPAVAFPFGPPLGPPPGLGGLGVVHGLGAPHPGLIGPPHGFDGLPPGLAGPRAGLGGPLPRTGFGARAGLGASGHPAGLSHFGGGSLSSGYRQSAHAGYRSGHGHDGSRYGRWVRDGVYGAATSGYGSSSDGYSSSSGGCSYVYGYGGDGYRRVVVCSDN